MHISIKKIISSLLIFVWTTGAAQKLPAARNQTDANQKRQGEWIIWMDVKWQPTTDSSNVFFYRHINYKDGQPIGSVIDHYRNGAKQYEGTLLQDRPEEIMEGIQTWYYPTGEKRVVETYVKGESKGQEVFLRSGEPGDPEWVTHYYQPGEHLSNEKNYEAAAQKFLKSIENAEAYYSRESEEYAAVADWLGIVYSLSEKYDKAIPYQEEYVSVRKLIHPQPDTLMMGVLKDLGTSYRMQENFYMAKKTLREFVNRNASYFNGNHPDFAMAIQMLGTVCEKLHEYNNALTYLTDARKLFEEDRQKYEYAHISNLLVLSGLYLTTGDFAKGEEYLLKELPKLKSKYGRQSEYYYTALSLLARIHVGAAQYGLAENEWKEVLDIIQSAQGNQSEFYAQMLASLAELNVIKGNMVMADKLIRKSLKIFHTKNSLSLSYLEFLSKLSVVYGYMGNKQALLQTSEKRKEVAAQLYGSRSVEYARTLLTLADGAFIDRDWKRCEQLIQEAIGIYSNFDFNSLSEMEKINLALLKSRLGTIYLMKHFSKPESARLASADRYLKEAITIFEKLPEKIFSINITDTYLAYAMVYEYKQDFQQADRLYHFVYENVRKQWGENHPYLINTLFLIAKKSEIRKDYKTSFENYKRAIALHQQYIRNVFPYLSENEKEQFYEMNKDMMGGFYGFGAQYFDQLSGLAETWCNVILDQKGIVLHSFAPIRDAIFNSNDQEIKRIFGLWQEIKNKHGQLLLNERADREEIKKTSLRLNDLEKNLAERAKALNLNFKYSTMSWQEVQHKLKPGEAAVEIVYAVSDRETGADSAYYALVIRPDLKEPQVVRLLEKQQAEGKSLKFYRNSIKMQQEDLISYSTYFSPLEKILEKDQIIYWSADGVYHQINPATLFNPNTKKYLAEEKRIRNVPSITWITKNKNANPILEYPFFFAHPDYGVASVSKSMNLTRSLDLDNIVDLPGTETELNELTQLMKANHISCRVFEKELATEEAIKKIQSPQVLHIATHGYFLPSLESKNNFENSLLRSGLLLAGCQKNQATTDEKKEDGVLTAYEASTLSLYNTVLVVMSACETGLGDVKNGEGVYGLQRAFFMAGAHQLLMSLWKVDDQATQWFMVLFYQEWIKSRNLNQAFHQAQLQVKEKYPHPFYWGAFILNGY
ncbi:MAG: CHAT domain-containing protein [Bacteroidetes bacterium]|nr:CHAT domain-containing protein [Bacteroidota bacterium]